MAQEFLSQFQVAGLGIDEAARRMSESVKASRARMASDAQPVESRIEHIAPENVRAEWRAIDLAKNKVLCPGVARTAKMLYQSHAKCVPKGNRADTALCLWRNQLALPEAVFDAQLSRLEVNMLPLQAKQFPKPCAGEPSTSEQRPVWWGY